jgi:hypothetical protein
MVRYSFLVGLFHPRLHAGLSRRLRSITVAALIQRSSGDASSSEDASGGRLSDDGCVGIRAMRAFLRGRDQDWRRLRLRHHRGREPFM